MGVGLFGAGGVLVVLGISSHLYVSRNRAAADRDLVQSYERWEFSPEEIRSDVAFLEDLIDRVHPEAVPSQPLGDIGPELRRLAGEVEVSWTRLRLYRRLAPVVHAMNDEHVTVFPPEPALARYLEEGGGLFPLPVQFLQGRLYVAGARHRGAEADPGEERPRNRAGIGDREGRSGWAGVPDGGSMSDRDGSHPALTTPTPKASQGPDRGTPPMIPPGSEILSINGVPADELRATMLDYYPGTREAQKVFYLQEHFSQALWFVHGLRGPFTVELQEPGTAGPVRRLVAGVNALEPEPEASRWDPLPPDGILLTWNAFEDPRGVFSDFLGELFSAVRDRNIRRLVVDLRGNQGGAAAYGDQILSRLTSLPFRQVLRSDVTVSPEVRKEFLSYVPPFLRWFPVQYIHPLLRPLWTTEEGRVASMSFDPIHPDENELRFAGEVVVLTGPGTMSSASLFAATIQSHGLGVLVGEATGGHATHYGNVVELHLPHTGLKVWVPTSVNHGNGTGPVVPDYQVYQTVPDLVDGRDTVLEMARNLGR